jgi:hypothetical protein
MVNRIITCLIITLLSGNIFSQTTVKDADNFLYTGVFEDALEIYLAVIDEEPENMAVNYKIAVCYLNTNLDKTLAVSYLEKFVTQEEYDNNANYLLGRAYGYASMFEDAEKKFYEYLSTGGGTASSGAETQKQIEYCQNAKELMKYPVDVTFENLGDAINSNLPDYFPFVPVDESYLIFNTARDDGSISYEDGTFASNVYISKVVDGKFTTAIPLGENINDNEVNEEIVGLSADGNTMLIFKEDKNGNGNLFITSREGGVFEVPVKLEETINSKNHEISATISADGNTIIFASDRNKGHGGTDLYVSKKLPIGGWGPPQNIGELVNTEFDEDFPNLSPDGKTLYFSSKGHVSMGGYDIFKAEWNGATKHYENVRSIGYPINTPYDDMNFRVSDNGRYGYLAAMRPEGKGDVDIYRVTFNKVEPKFTAIVGHIKTDDPANRGEDAFLSITDNQTGDIVGDYLPTLRNMKYVMILPPGEYNLYIEAEGFHPISEDISILDKISFQSEILRDFTLKKL